MNLLYTSWNWVTARSAWRIPAEVRETKESLKNKTPPSLMQKIKIGLWDGFSENPRLLVICALARWVFPFSTKAHESMLTVKCIAFLETYVPPSPSLFSLDNWVVGNVFEELVFRVGVQN
jgi:hypothetical protein